MVERRGEDDSSSTNKLILKKAVSKKIKHIKAKAFISEREVYELIRGFFKKYLDIDYEFTHQELVKELRRVYMTPELQKRVNSIFKEISRIEHSSVPFQKEEIISLLDEFNLMVDALIVTHYQKESSFGRKLKDSIHNLFSKKHETMLDVDESVLSENERAIVKMNMLLDNAKRLSDKDVAQAKKKYKELLEVYNKLDPGKKKVFFRPVNELFQMIKSKEL